MRWRRHGDIKSNRESSGQKSTHKKIGVMKNVRDEGVITGGHSSMVSLVNWGTHLHKIICRNDL